MMESSPDKMRAWLHSEDVGLSRQGADKVQTATVVAAWEAAVGRTSTQRQQEADQRTAGLPAAIPGGVFVIVHRAREANLEPGQTLSPTESPAKSFLEWRTARVSDGITRRSLQPAGGVGPDRRPDADRLRARRQQNAPRKSEEHDACNDRTASSQVPPLGGALGSARYTPTSTAPQGTSTLCNVTTLTGCRVTKLLRPT